jgi:hypothetical protein
MAHSGETLAVAVAVAVAATEPDQGSAVTKKFR